MDLFDNLLWPEAPDVLHVHILRAASLNSRGVEGLLGFVIAVAALAHKQVCKIAQSESALVSSNCWNRVSARFSKGSL